MRLRAGFEMRDVEAVEAAIVRGRIGSNEDSVCFFLTHFYRSLLVLIVLLAPPKRRVAFKRGCWDRIDAEGGCYFKAFIEGFWVGEWVGGVSE